MWTLLVVMHSSWQWLLAVQKIARGSWWLVCCESPGDPEATVAVSCWPEDRSKGYKQMVTGVSCRYFHFQNGSTRTLLAAYPITVGETRARWQALASPGEKQCALLREHLGGWPSPPRGPEHRCALLAETYIWEGDGPQRGHRWWPEMVPDKCWKKVLSLPRKVS